MNMDLMKSTNYALYNDLVMLGLDQLICEVTNLYLDHMYFTGMVQPIIDYGFV